MDNLTEVPTTPKLRCPTDEKHHTFQVAGLRGSKIVDENHRPVESPVNGKPTCTECGTPARVREQLNG